MKKSESLIDYFDGIEEVFNPYVVYEGNYGFSANVFLYASKYKDGKNLFEEYLDKKYVSQIKSIFSKLKFTSNPRFYFVSDVNGNYGRKLNLCIDLFLREMSYNLTGDCPELSSDVSIAKEQLVNYLRSYRKCISNIMNDTLDEEALKIKQKLEVNYKINEEHRKSALGKNYRPLGYNKFLEVIKDYITSFIVGLRYVVPLFEKSIDLKELEECLDLDMFYLAMVKQLIEVTKIALEQDKKVHNSFVFIEKYINVVRKLRETKKYNLKIKTCLMDGTVISYSVDDALREYNEIKIANPEFVVYSFDYDGADYRDVNTALEFTTQVEEYVESKKLEAAWNFIKNGEYGKRQEVSDEVVIRLNETKNKKKISREQKIQQVNDRMYLLDHTDYLYKISGKNNFEGYIGYIYSNGKVIFEKFYKKIDSHEPSDSNATYVMTFNNFVEMSKLSKPEIIQYIKNGGTDVRRVYHTSNWYDNIKSIISGKTYDEKAISKIERLISEGQISRKK